MPAFIQITDTHIVPKGQLAYGRSDTATALECAVSTINDHLPLLGEDDCAIITGDLTDHGTPEEYDRLKAIMAPLTLPWLAIPGNHDHRETMRAAFIDQDWMPPSGPIEWRRDFGTFTLIGLDTLLDGAHYGALSREGFSFVDRVLSEIGDQPAVIATHHPWMLSGIRAMDADNLRNGAPLMERLQAHPGTVRMISGHVHRALTTQIGKVTCQIAPAPCHAVHLDCREGATNDLTLEPGAVTIYSWAERPAPLAPALNKLKQEGPKPEGPEPALVSNLLPIGKFPGPWPFAF